MLDERRAQSILTESRHIGPSRYFRRSRMDAESKVILTAFDTVRKCVRNAWKTEETVK